MGFSLHDADNKNKYEDDENDEEEEEENPSEDIQGKEPGKDDLDYVHKVQIENGGLIPSSSLRHWTHSQQARQEEAFSLVEEILSDEDKSRKSQKEAEITCKEKVTESASRGGELESNASSNKANRLPNQKDPEGEGDDPVLEDPNHQEPEKEGDEELNVKEVSMTKFNSKDKVLVKALTEAHDKCYIEDNLTVQMVRGGIMGLESMPTMEQVCSQKLFQVGPPGNHVMDDIQRHWVSYLVKFGVLANAPYSQFWPAEGWNAVYTWELLEEHEPRFYSSFGQKAAKPSLIMIIDPTTSEKGDNYFLNKLHI